MSFNRIRDDLIEATEKAAEASVHAKSPVSCQSMNDPTANMNQSGAK